MSSYVWAMSEVQRLEHEVECLRKLLDDALAWVEPSLGGQAAASRIRRELSEGPGAGR